MSTTHHKRERFHRSPLPPVVFSALRNVVLQPLGRLAVRFPPPACLLAVDPIVLALAFRDLVVA